VGLDIQPTFLEHKADVSIVLSQSKWLRMQKRSKLDDFNVIDNASRGLRGAVQVLFKPNLG
jgi:hypothetical protein